MDEAFLRQYKLDLKDIRKRLDATTQQPRSEYTGGFVRKANADLPAPGMAGRAFWDTTYGVLEIDTSAEYVLAGTVVRTFAGLPSAGKQGRTAYDTTNDVMVYDIGSAWHQFSTFPVYTVANLPNPGYAGQVAFASNGRKATEGAGAGTGVPVYWNSNTNQWFNFYNNLVVAV